MTRTSQQNRALHLWLERLAEALNDAGYSVNDRIVLKAEISFTKENLKENVFKPVMRALYPEKKSTAELGKIEITEVYDEVNRFLAQRVPVDVPPWPTEEQLN